LANSIQCYWTPKDNTIEALMRKSDAEVGLEALLGQEPHRRRRQQQN